MSGGGFSSTGRGVDGDLPMARVQDFNPSITMVVRGTEGHCRVGGSKLAVARVADHEPGKGTLLPCRTASRWRVDNSIGCVVHRD